MALPPTLIYRYICGKHEDTYRKLKSAGLIGTVDKDAFVRDLAAAEKSYFTVTKGSQATGPNLDDTIALALSKYLNKAGRKLAMADSRWVPMPEQITPSSNKLLSRIKAFFKRWYSGKKDIQWN